MNGKNNSNNKKIKKESQDIYKENKNISINSIKSLNKKANKNQKPFFINNQNHIESINIINNNINYKNIILQNLPTPNKKYTISGKDSSRNTKNIKLEKNILFDFNNNNFQTIVHKKQKSLNKNNTLKLMLNPIEQENYNLNDNEMKYKIKLYEKNNIINKLKDELEYYKSYYHSMNQNNSKNIIIPSHKTINVTDDFHSNKINKLNYGLHDKNKIIKTEDLRNKIKNIFSLNKNEIKDFKKRNINNLKIKIENDVEIINNSRINKESALTIENKSENKNKNRNKLIISNNTLKFNNKGENISDISNNIFYRSNSNTIKRKIKLGLHLSELNLDTNEKYNSIEANSKHINYIQNKNNLIYSLNKNVILKGIYQNENKDTTFNYVDKFENLKQRMNNLVTNLFGLLDKKFKQ